MIPCDRTSGLIDDSATSEQTQDALTHYISAKYAEFTNPGTMPPSLRGPHPPPPPSVQPQLSPPSPWQQQSNTGSIVGGTMVGVIGLIIILVTLIIYRNMQTKYQQIVEGTTGRLSVISGGARWATLLSTSSARLQRP
ncbi:hypothetical protein FRB94_001491 [Tulasnella sp. JGI-2019a]|nr:hypothetical protein FRB94_001491 [Tulasnella sp. JGI-2019a]